MEGYSLSSQSETKQFYRMELQSLAIIYVPSAHFFYRQQYNTRLTCVFFRPM